MKLFSTLAAAQQQLDAIFPTYLPQSDADYPQLNAALHHAIFNGGKRLRPALVYFTGVMLGVTIETLDPIACAVELVHCFSLVHDDLPAMDNADYRRGKPSCHKMFGEDIAILAGDTLLALSLEILSDTKNARISDCHRLALIHLLCKATGAEGMVGGQIMDVKNAAQYDQRQLQKLHQLKTGALIKASILMGATCAPSPIAPNIQQALNTFADTLGLLYQICDDVLDVIADEKILGKATGADRQLGKGTYVDLLGLAATREYALTLYGQACDILRTIDNSATLIALVHSIYQRIV